MANKGVYIYTILLVTLQLLYMFCASYY